MWRILYLGLDPSHYRTTGTVTHWPIIKIVPRHLSDIVVQASLQAFACYSHVIITSKSMVHVLCDYLDQLNIAIEAWQKKTTIAVGDITAQHLRARGIESRIAASATAEGVVQTLACLQLQNAHIFWPHSEQARPIIQEFLTAHAIRHTACPCYGPVVHIPAALPSLHMFDEIVFTSPSTVKAFLEVFGQFPPQVHLTPIGPVTSQVLLHYRRTHSSPISTT